MWVTGLLARSLVKWWISNLILSIAKQSLLHIDNHAVHVCISLKIPDIHAQYHLQVQPWAIVFFRCGHQRFIENMKGFHRFEARKGIWMNEMFFLWTCHPMWFLNKLLLSYLTHYIGNIHFCDVCSSFWRFHKISWQQKFIDNIIF